MNAMYYIYILYIYNITLYLFTFQWRASSYRILKNEVRTRTAVAEYAQNYFIATICCRSYFPFTTVKWKTTSAIDKPKMVVQNCH